MKLCTDTVDAYVDWRGLGQRKEVTLTRSLGRQKSDDRFVMSCRSLPLVLPPRLGLCRGFGQIKADVDLTHQARRKGKEFVVVCVTGRKLAFINVSYFTSATSIDYESSGSIGPVQSTDSDVSFTSSSFAI